MQLVRASGRLENAVVTPLEELTDAAPLIANSIARVCDALALFAKLIGSAVAAGATTAILSALGFSAGGYADGFTQAVDTLLLLPTLSADAAATVRTAVLPFAVGIAAHAILTETSFSALAARPSTAVGTALVALACGNALRAIHRKHTRRIGECFVGAGVLAKTLDPAADESVSLGRAVYLNEFTSLTTLDDGAVAATVNADFSAVVIHAVVLQTAHAFCALTTRAAAAIVTAVLSIAGDEGAFPCVAVRTASALAARSPAPIVAAVLVVALRFADAREIDTVVVSETLAATPSTTVVSTLLAKAIGDADAGSLDALAVATALPTRATAAVRPAFLAHAGRLADFNALPTDANVITGTPRGTLAIAAVWTTLLALASRSARRDE